MLRMINKTFSKEDYLHEIYHLLDDANPDQYVKNIELANIIGVKPSSVTEMIEKLDKEGYVVWTKRRGITLTSEGKKLAAKVHESSKLMRQFVKEFLNIKNERLVNRLSHVLEHFHDPEFMNAVKKITKNQEKILQK
ncbi:MAG: metal-dependent transcriptional regulator [Promethearchaeota archaeon]